MVAASDGAKDGWMSVVDDEIAAANRHELKALS